MPRRKFKITRLPKSKRWRKKYKGRQLYFSFADCPTAQDAWEAFLKKKAEIDLELQANKPNRSDYERAIRDRQDLAEWCRQSGDQQQAAIFQDEADLLLHRFNRSASPPPLSKDEADPLSSVVRLKLDEIKAEISPELPSFAWPDLHAAEREVRAIWEDRLSRPHHAEKHKTVRANADDFLKRKEAKAQSKELSAGRVAVLAAHLKRFCAWIGDGFPIDSMSSKHLEDYHTYLLAEIAQGHIARHYAQHNMTTLKQFVRWAWELDLCPLPKKITSKDLSFNITTEPIEVFTEAELKSLLKDASERTRLYILLGLNIGATQIDVASLTHSQVDLDQGTITRKRTKTKNRKDVPTVRYPLWSETRALLGKHRSDHPELFLTNSKGQPLRVESYIGGKYAKIDNVMAHRKKSATLI